MRPPYLADFGDHFCLEFELLHLSVLFNLEVLGLGKELYCFTENFHVRHHLLPVMGFSLFLCLFLKKSRLYLAPGEDGDRLAGLIYSL